MKKLFTAAFFLCFGIHSFAQIEWVNFKNSGQYKDAFTCIEFDENNEPWAGTILNGLHHFKGENYVSYNTSNSKLPSDKIYDLLFSADRQLWVATSNGLALYKENSWMIYNTENSGLPSNTVISLAKGSGGRIWIGTGKGVMDGLNGIVYNQTNTPLHGEVFYHILTDSKNNTWFATEKEIARFDGKNWNIYNSENTVLPAELALTIEEDHAGRIWASLGNTYDGTLAAFENGEWKIFDENILYNLTSRVSSIVSLADETVWFGTHDKGLVCKNDSVWKSYTTDNSEIPINQIICMKKDRKDRLWLGHRNGLTLVTQNGALNSRQIENSEKIVYQNPLQEGAIIHFNGIAAKPYCLEVMDLSGKTVYREQNISGSFKINCQQFGRGVFLFRFYNSQRRFCRKVIVQ